MGAAGEPRGTSQHDRQARPHVPESRIAHYTTGCRDARPLAKRELRLGRSRPGPDEWPCRAVWGQRAATKSSRFYESREGAHLGI